MPSSEQGRDLPPQAAIVKPASSAQRRATQQYKPSMPDDNQTVIPRSFIDLFIPPGAHRPREPREVVAARYELCEDMAQMLTEHARMKLFELGVTEEDVLARVHQGLLVPGSVVAEDEARWVVCRLAELLDWPMPFARLVA